MNNSNNINSGGWITVKRNKVTHRKLSDNEKCKINRVDYNNGQLIASCTSCELQNHRLELEAEDKHFILEKLNTENRKCLSVFTCLKILKLFDTSDFEMKPFTGQKLGETRNKCTLRLEHFVRNLRRDSFGKRQRVVCDNNNYSCVASIHDRHFEQTKTVPGYEFKPKTRIEPLTCVEQSCKTLIMERTMNDFEIDELIAAARNMENNCVLFRHNSSFAHFDRIFAACDVFLYYFLKKCGLPFIFECEKMHVILAYKDDYQLWCKCHSGLRNNNCIVMDHRELKREMNAQECCLLCNSFASVTQQMKEITGFQGHFKDCKYFIDV